MAHTDRVDLTVHERDPATLREGLEQWLPDVLGHGPVVVSDLVLPEAGYSSATVIFAARDAAGPHQLVARLPPERSSFPVFRGYDFGFQRDVIEAVRRVGVPAPRVLALESTGEVFGAPLLLFERLEGEVPSDNPPYLFGGWLLEADREQRRRLLRGSVDVLATVHAADWSSIPGLSGDDALRRHFEDQRAYYAWAVAEDGVRIPVLEDAFDWLEQRWPSTVGDPVLCWGDARIGNLGYTDFVPTAAFDWEMACVGPRELDLGWFCFLHRFFQDIAEVFELPGMPTFLHRDDVATAYRNASGHEVRDFDWYLGYAALRHGNVMCRIKRRMIHFGQDQVPDDPDDYVIHQASLRRLMAGTYDWGTPEGLA
ncbi:phosphotransferase family protein [Nocardioides terrisoli]|uniref:phosphotransferase family protein n=1 Tax=Nocardioides terrisoli TaxID=3388267 RepID=UPI00287BB8A8|nr:phosphotransferase family protein [Nocardioides marmorisolisilvae]